MRGERGLAQSGSSRQSGRTRFGAKDRPYRGTHEASRTGGFACEISAIVMEEALSSLRALSMRVTGPDIPVPSSPPLEAFYIPNEENLVSAMREILITR